MQGRDDRLIAQNEIGKGQGPGNMIIFLLERAELLARVLRQLH
jgi:hypothetical protein